MLKAFLSDLRRKDFALGSVDCGLSLADWWLAVHGVDPAADLRADYASEAEVEQIFFRHGCLPRLVAKRAAAVGARRTRRPVAGDIAVIRVFGVWAGAIMTETGWWAVKRGPGLSHVRPERVDRLVAAWSVGA
ncbi:MAG: hypothetical protein DI565_00710 [Ancylobacter novellus]|uniref:DUF6950 domain-containing protein n=1 Tax=Ancylobacter novellus TaxID=921 RepID=A0A2W5KU58_ANCNO|nr:MAG: hypothetical protein DI565_00710 [Ancylobacter novellus]